MSPYHASDMAIQAKQAHRSARRNLMRPFRHSTRRPIVETPTPTGATTTFDKALDMLRQVRRAYRARASDSGRWARTLGALACAAGLTVIAVPGVAAAHQTAPAKAHTSSPTAPRPRWTQNSVPLLNPGDST